jgi:hypothetical protein
MIRKPSVFLVFNMTYKILVIGKNQVQNLFAACSFEYMIRHILSIHKTEHLARLSRSPHGGVCPVNVTKVEVSKKKESIEVVTVGLSQGN